MSIYPVKYTILEVIAGTEIKSVLIRTEHLPLPQLLSRPFSQFDCYNYTGYFIFVDSVVRV